MPTLTDPIRGEGLFGRDDILERLRVRVRGLVEGYRQNVAIVGRRSVGKSSIIHRLLAELRDVSCVPVYVEVRQEPFVRFADRWMATVIAQLAPLQTGISADLWEADRHHLEEQYPSLHEAVERIRQLCNRSAYAQAFEQLLRLPAALGTALQRPPIVILESFERLGQWAIDEPFAILGRQIMVQPETMFLVTSAVPHEARRILSERFSLLFGNFEVIEVASFDLGSSAQYLRDTVRSAALSPTMAAFLAELTGGVPFYLRTLGRHMESLAIERSIHEIGIDQVASTFERTLFEVEGTLHHYCAARLQECGALLQREPVDTLLVTLEQRRHRFSDICRLVPRSAQGVAHCLNQLMQAGLVERSGGFAYLADPLWGLWKCHVHRPRDIGPDGDLAGMAERFRSTLGYRYERFAKTCHRDPIDRMVALFQSFRRDLVHLNHYDRWLIPFEAVTAHAAGALGGTLIEAVGWEGRWLGLVVNEGVVTESQVAAFTEWSRGAKPSWHRRILIPLGGIGESAAMFAKAEQIWVWPLDTVRFLLRLYGEPPLFPASHVASF